MSQKVTLVTLTNYGKVRVSAVGSDYKEGSNPPLATNCWEAIKGRFPIFVFKDILMLEVHNKITYRRCIYESRNGI